MFSNNRINPPSGVLNAAGTTSSDTTAAPSAGQQATQPGGLASRTSGTQPAAPRLSLPQNVVQALASLQPHVQASTRVAAYYPAALAQGLNASGQALFNEFRQSSPRDWRGMRYALHPTHSSLQFATPDPTGNLLHVGLDIRQGQVVRLNVTRRTTGESVNMQCAPSSAAAPQAADLALRLNVDVPMSPTLALGLTNSEMAMVADMLGTPAAQRRLLRYEHNAGQQTNFAFAVQTARGAATARPGSFVVSGTVRFGQIDQCTVTERSTNRTVTMPMVGPALQPATQAQQVSTGTPVPVTDLASLFATQPPIPASVVQTQPVVFPGQGFDAVHPGANGRFTIGSDVARRCMRGARAVEWNAGGAVDQWAAAHRGQPRRAFIDAVVAAANAVAAQPGAATGVNPPLRQAQAGLPAIWRFDLGGFGNQPLPVYIAFTDRTLSEVAEMRALAPGRSEADLLRSMTNNANRA